MRRVENGLCVYQKVCVCVNDVSFDLFRHLCVTVVAWSALLRT